MKDTIMSTGLGKSLGRALVGALFGAAGAALFLSLFDKPDLGDLDLSSLIAIIAGLCYGLMGLLVFLGMLAPAAGAHFLNVEDDKEIRDQRSTLGPSAISMILIGLLFLVLVIGSTPTTLGLISGDAAALVAGACLIGVVAVHLVTRGRSDELIRQVSKEASALAMHVALVVAVTWAILAQTGYAEWLSALGAAALLALLELASIFWICGRRGLLSQG